MKKSLFFAILLLVSLFIPWACSDNNNNPTKPPNAIGGATNTPTPLSGSTPAGTPLPITLTPTPTFVNNYGTSASPNGMYYDGLGNLQVMEGVPGVTNWATYNVNAGTGTLTRIGLGNLIAVGVPTPNATPGPWVAPVTNVLQLPQGFAYTPVGNGGAGWYGILDSSPSGSAIFYEGNNWPTFGFDVPNYTVGYASITFSSPRAVVGDLLTENFYIADTGNGYVDEMGGASFANGGLVDINWPHRWNGSTSNFQFKKPVVLAIDANDNLFVGDQGYNPSVVEEYAQQGTYLEGQWVLTAGCSIVGLAVDSLTPEDIYVSDAANGGQVEEYQITGYNTVSLVRTWNIPVNTISLNGYHEYNPFSPSCIALIQAGLAAVPPTQIVVGDVNNNLIDVFGP